VCGRRSILKTGRQEEQRQRGNAGRGQARGFRGEEKIGGKSACEPAGWGMHHTESRTICERDMPFKAHNWGGDTSPGANIILSGEVADLPESPILNDLLVR